jgi:hypothetical protein
VDKKPATKSHLRSHRTKLPSQSAPPSTASACFPAPDGQQEQQPMPLSSSCFNDGSLSSIVVGLKDGGLKDGGIFGIVGSLSVGGGVIGGLVSFLGGISCMGRAVGIVGVIGGIGFVDCIGVSSFGGIICIGDRVIGVVRCCPCWRLANSLQASASSNGLPQFLCYEQQEKTNFFSIGTPSQKFHFHRLTQRLRT